MRADRKQYNFEQKLFQSKIDILFKNKFTMKEISKLTGWSLICVYRYGWLYHPN